ncbi:MAG: gliding motility lipoprotein GldB [Winogradskyella sp.]|uniref:gliding motility lipoprotein GldB n=1 Tax=Winogradskyella sp. TaxID=1883156 RepID=UPI0017F0F4FA|nr:gliding motility lipoprotein GldB [Winogradskyella sp.]
MRNYLVLIWVLCFLSCNDDSKLINEIENISIDFEIDRFDSLFKNATSKDLPKLKKSYPFLFSAKVPDSIYINRMTDSLQNVVLNEVESEFTNSDKLHSEISLLFKYLKYYDKSFTVPRVITLTNNVAYRDRTIVTDTLVLIALDNYLGDSHRFYTESDIPMYLAKNFKSEQIVSDLAGDYAEKYNYQKNRKTLLDEMIYFGKLLYFKDVVLPFKTDAEKIGYTEDELKWAEANESPIWSYFIEKEMLYSTDSTLPNRFIADAPFTKFYLELDNESPGRLGQYIGWQIVRAYAETTDKGVLNIMQTEAEEIFRKSKFKPKK